MVYNILLAASMKGLRFCEGSSLRGTAEESQHRRATNMVPQFACRWMYYEGTVIKGCSKGQT